MGKFCSNCGENVEGKKFCAGCGAANNSAAAAVAASAPAPIAASSATFAGSADGLVLYSSSVAGSVKVNKETDGIKLILNGKRVAFKEVDVSLPEHDAAKLLMQSASGKKILPQLHKVSGGAHEYLGGFKELSEANETETLSAFFS